MASKTSTSSDPLLNPSHISHLQYSTRDLPPPKFRAPVEIRGPSNRAVRSVAYSPDGKRLATGHEVRGLRVWDVRDRKAASGTSGAGASSGSGSSGTSASGTSAATGTGTGTSTNAGMDPTTTIHLPQAGDKASPHVGYVSAIAWSPKEGNILASGCKVAPRGAKVPAMLCIWDINAPKAPIFTCPLPSDCYSLTFHPSGDHIAVVCQRGSEDEALFFSRMAPKPMSADVVEGGAGADVKGQSGGEADVGVEEKVWARREDLGLGGDGADMLMEELNNFRFSNSGKYLMAVSDDGSISAWSFPTERRSLVAPSATTSSTVSGTAAGSGSGPAGNDRVEAGDGDVEMDATAEVDDTGKATATATATAIEENEQGNSAGDEKGASVPAPTPASSRASKRAKTSKPSQPTSSTSTGSSTLASTSASVSTVTSQPHSQLKGRELVRARQLRRIKHSVVYSAHLLAMGLDPTGKYLAVGGQDALLSLYTSRDWVCVRTFDCVVQGQELTYSGVIRHIVFSPDGELMAVGGDDKFIYIVSVYSGEVIHKQSIKSDLLCLAWHPVHNWLAYVCKSSGVSWWLLQQE